MSSTEGATVGALVFDSQWGDSIVTLDSATTFSLPTPYTGEEEEKKTGEEGEGGRVFHVHSVFATQEGGEGRGEGGGEDAVLESGCMAFGHPVVGKAVVEGVEGGVVVGGPRGGLLFGLGKTRMLSEEGGPGNGRGGVVHFVAQELLDRVGSTHSTTSTHTGRGEERGVELEVVEVGGKRPRDLMSRAFLESARSASHYSDRVDDGGSNSNGNGNSNSNSNGNSNSNNNSNSNSSSRVATPCHHLPTASSDINGRPP